MRYTSETGDELRELLIDRRYNIACIAGRIYAGDRTRLDMLNLSVSALRKLCEAKNAFKASGLLSEKTDLDAVYEARPDIKHELTTIAAASKRPDSDDGSG